MVPTFESGVPHVARCACMHRIQLHALTSEIMFFWRQSAQLRTPNFQVTVLALGRLAHS